MSELPSIEDMVGPGFTDDACTSHAAIGRYYTDPLVFVFNMAPSGVDRCAEEITYFTLDAEMTEPSRTAEAYISEQLNEEDIALVEAVHRGVGSRGYRPGRLMVDAEEKEGWSEHFVHHFNQLNVAALRRHEPSSESARPNE